MIKKKLINKVSYKAGALILASAIFLATNGISVFATNDPLAVIDNLKNFMYQIIGAIGTILLLWGIVQVGMAIKSHDPSQRANGFMTIAGGVMIAFAKQILELIIG